MGKSCLLQLLPNINKCRGTGILLGVSMPQPPTAISTGLQQPQGNAERARELHFHLASTGVRGPLVPTPQGQTVGMS